MWTFMCAHCPSRVRYTCRRPRSLHTDAATARHTDWVHVNVQIHVLVLILILIHILILILIHIHILILILIHIHILILILIHNHISR
jgi:hypothetical protein